jgi:HPt (histidine-containing phosphotransfer) domain-containing protein
MSTYASIFIFILILASIIYFYTKRKNNIDNTNNDTLVVPDINKSTTSLSPKKRPTPKTTVQEAVVNESLNEEQPAHIEAKEIVTETIEETVVEKTIIEETEVEKVDFSSTLNIEEKASQRNDLPTMSKEKFSHSRLMEMGLSDDEAKEFVQDLIGQIETHIPLIKDAIAKSDYVQLDELTHSIKGSATNIGTGGVSELLSDFNTYVKEGRDISVVQRYFMLLRFQLKALEKQYS